MNKSIIDELNTFLKGNYMAIHAYDRYLQNIDDSNVRQVFQIIQANHRKHAQLIKKRILALRGEPADNAGMIGKMVEWMYTFKQETTELAHIIKDAQTGEYRGIKKSKEMLENDLDEESLALVKQILKKDEEHVALLTKLLESNN